MGSWAPPDPSKELIDALECLRGSTTPALQGNGSGCYLTLIKCRIDEDICTAAEVFLPCSTYKSNAANMASAVIVARTIRPDPRVRPMTRPAMCRPEITAD
jgi:hypothetical protein